MILIYTNGTCYDQVGVGRLELYLTTIYVEKSIYLYMDLSRYHSSLVTAYVALGMDVSIHIRNTWKIHIHISILKNIGMSSVIVIRSVEN